MHPLHPLRLPLKRSHQSVHSISRSKRNDSLCWSNSHRAKRKLSIGGSVEGFHSFQGAGVTIFSYQATLVWPDWPLYHNRLLNFSAVVKTELGPEKTCLKREHGNYRLPTIAGCQYLRPLYDVVGPEDHTHWSNMPATGDPPCMVFEWMEHDLRTVPSDEFRENSILAKIIAKSILSTLAHIKTQFNGIHTGGCLSCIKR